MKKVIAFILYFLIYFTFVWLFSIFFSEKLEVSSTITEALIFSGVMVFFFMKIVRDKKSITKIN
ncbi:hypothetical protein [Xenorhabdus anantnagensis]|uniref:Uncharacterized protein n=1 Tax=Xenorhabdus anantnagensis TaxID=3025875 RepID=A0ABT5LLQ0_9GAMM|nr:hypothetical protein [Xenorhabdus anantnagensis]MDC9595331.1 hypothetical protein [Xenorhabdus anantnagensis]